MPESEGITAEELRTRADQLREVLRVLDDRQVQASARERAYIAGALRAVELMGYDGAGLDGPPDPETQARDGSQGRAR